MHRFILRLTIALLTFVLGIAAVSLWFKFRHPSSVTIKCTENLSPAPAPAQPEKGLDVDGRIISKDGVSIAFSVWYTSDGVRFSRSSEFHTSPERANKELEKALKEALEIIKREPLFDRSGFKVGEKVIATFLPKHSKYGVVSLLWTEGATFRYLTSSSLENILAHEKDFNGQLR